MTDEALLAACQQRRLFEGQWWEIAGRDRVDPAEDDVQAFGNEPVLDRPLADPARVQLLRGRERPLLRGDSRDLPISPPARHPANPTFGQRRRSTVHLATRAVAEASFTAGGGASEELAGGGASEELAGVRSEATRADCTRR